MIKKLQEKNSNGFVALISVIIISAILLLVATSLSLTGFFGRFNILESEFKERSSALAEACIDIASLRLTQGLSTPNNFSATVGSSDSCNIITIQSNSPSSGQTLIKTRGVYQHATTNLQVVLKTLDLSVISWEELP